ncbi:polyprenyl synthetase family protein [Streptomyces cyaneofuscatus]|uniref:polyprenyl synthetase family protein n=1 Tax=Streptomyces cyaneofuscatus TaxID=66883 RepID=UPI0036461792
MALGAALAGAGGRTTSALCSAGSSAGIAFQLYDDRLSVFGDSSVTGKPSGEDIRAGKLTYLTAVARTLSEEAGDASARHVLNRSLGDPSLSGAGLDELRREQPGWDTWLRKHGGPPDRTNSAYSSPSTCIRIMDLREVTDSFVRHRGKRY